MRDDTLVSLVLVMAPLSLASFGGGSGILAPLQHDAIDVYGWLTPRDFADFFAIARAAPGPGTMISTLVGFHVAGWWGALVATLAMFVPSSLLCFFAGRAWNAYRGRDWHKAIEQGLAPIAAGLILSGITTVASLAGAGWLSIAFALVALAVLLRWPRFHPLMLMGAGSLVFFLVTLVRGV